MNKLVPQGTGVFPAVPKKAPSLLDFLHPPPGEELWIGELKCATCGDEAQLQLSTADPTFLAYLRNGTGMAVRCLRCKEPMVAPMVRRS